MARKLKGKKGKQKGLRYRRRQPKPVVLVKKHKAANRRRAEARKPLQEAYAAKVAALIADAAAATEVFTPDELERATGV